MDLYVLYEKLMTYVTPSNILMVLIWSSYFYSRNIQTIHRFVSIRTSILLLLIFSQDISFLITWTRERMWFDFVTILAFFLRLCILQFLISFYLKQGDSDPIIIIEVYIIIYAFQCCNAFILRFTAINLIKISFYQLYL